MEIELFMWGYQPHFRITAELFAKNVFNELDKSLKPKVFLVGILSEERKDQHPICIEPEDGPYNPTMFHDFQKIAESIETLDERSRMCYGGPHTAKRVKRRIKRDSIKNAIQQVIRQFDEDYNLKSFCSLPVLVEGYMVSAVLQLDLETFNSHHSLKTKTKNRISMSRSLLESTIEEYLKECSKALREPEPGTGFELTDRNRDEIIRSAGRQFMDTPVVATENFMGYNLFEAFNNISSLTYEGEDGTGKIIISKRGHPNIKVNLYFKSPINLHNYGAVRKLLEMSSNEICLLSDSEEIYGIGKLVELYDHTKEDLFTINFIKHYNWELIHANHILMKVSYGQPHLPRVKIDKEKFKGDIKRIFKDTINLDNIEKLWELISEAIKQEHGTIVVISEEAENEAERLKSQCIRIKKVEITPSLMKLVASIDGAVLINQKGICHAVGVILDGLASDKCTASRGARYNSAIKYNEFTYYPCLIVVISEDGLIDLIPNLMPQINHSKLEKKMVALHSLNDPEKDSVNFYKLMNWLDNHRFYLSPEYCDEINKIQKEFNEKMAKKGISYHVYLDFKPNEEMNNSYFFE